MPFENARAITRAPLHVLCQFMPVAYSVWEGVWKTVRFFEIISPRHLL